MRRLALFSLILMAVWGLLRSTGALAGERQRLLDKDGKPVAVAVYSGEGAYFRSIRAAIRMFQWMGADPRRITPGEIIRGELDRFDVLYMTGGWAVPYVRDLKGPGAERIRSFLRAGGGYIGICAGAFFAADYIYWEGKRYEYPLDIYAGYAKGPIVKIAPWPQFKLCEIRIQPPVHPVTMEEPPSLTSLYYGGPWFQVLSGGDVRVLATYEINGKPAMLTYRYGAGNVFLSGVHTEFEEGDDRDGVLWDNEMKDPESEWPLMLKAVRWITRKVP